MSCNTSWGFKTRRPGSGKTSGAVAGHRNDRERHDGPFARALKAEVQLERRRAVLAAGQWRGFGV